jgi:hypothetical protein
MLACSNRRGSNPRSDFLQEAPEKNCSDLHPRIDCPDESGHEMQKKTGIIKFIHN